MAVEAKRCAGRAAADLVEDGMKIGLGTGSTVEHALARLAERIGEGLSVVGVPTSEATARRAAELGIPTATLEELGRLDVDIDGADEVDAEKVLVKGGGGALLREKIVAAASDELIVIVSEDKLVDAVGATFDLPVEVLPFGWSATAAAVGALGCEPKLRRHDGGSIALTDNGNHVLDCAFGPISDPAQLERDLNAIPGVLGNGLFVGMAGRVIVGADDGTFRVLA